VPGERMDQHSVGLLEAHPMLCQILARLFRIPRRPIHPRDHSHLSEIRPNIPTAELESFARPEEKRPAIVRYPRDPTLDPQLVWKGKDERDTDDLKVSAV
jgi:hypothetical protein